MSMSEDYQRGYEQAWADAIATVERQTILTELVHFARPSDFRKGILTCLAALQAAPHHE